MKKIFSFVAAIICAASMMAEDAVVYGKYNKKIA